MVSGREKELKKLAAALVVKQEPLDDKTELFFLVMQNDQSTT